MLDFDFSARTTTSICSSQELWLAEVDCVDDNDSIPSNDHEEDTQEARNVNASETFWLKQAKQMGLANDHLQGFLGKLQTQHSIAVNAGLLMGAEAEPVKEDKPTSNNRRSGKRRKRIALLFSCFQSDRHVLEKEQPSQKGGSTDQNLLGQPNANFWLLQAQSLGLGEEECSGFLNRLAQQHQKAQTAGLLDGTCPQDVDTVEDLKDDSSGRTPRQPDFPWEDHASEKLSLTPDETREFLEQLTIIFQKYPQLEKIGLRPDEAYWLANAQEMGLAQEKIQQFVAELQRPAPTMSR